MNWLASFRVFLTVLFLCSLFGTAFLGLGIVQADDSLGMQSELHRPTSLALAEDGSSLLIANRDSGAVLVVETESNRVIDEVRCGESLVAICVVDKRRVLAADATGNQVHLLCKTASKPGEFRWSCCASIAVPGQPSALVYDADQSAGYVVSKWSRTLIRLSVEDDDSLRIERTLQLPTQPGGLFLVPSHNRLIITGAFAASIVQVDLRSNEVVESRSIGGHNLGKPAWDSRRAEFLFPKQLMSPVAEVSFNDVHWGNLMSNQIHVVPFGTEDLRERQEPYDVQVGEPGRGAGDPSCVVRLSENLFAVLVAGRNEVQFWKRGLDDGVGEFVATVPVGTRPMDAVVHDGKVYVANQLSDSISVIDIDTQKVIHEIRLSDSEIELTLAQRGEQLFFDSRLSLEGWMSCHSCHTDGHSNGQLNDNLSDGGFGSPKRVLSLLGVSETPPWTWTGRVDSLREQVVNSVTKTMQGDALPEDDVDAITAYMSSLSSPPTPISLGTSESARHSSEGHQLFGELGCNRCHVPQKYTSSRVFDVGLADAEGNTQFNPPSLRGVAHRGLFFHDGRAGSLQDVFERHRHQLEAPLDDSKLESLIEFLEGL